MHGRHLDWKEEGRHASARDTGQRHAASLEEKFSFPNGECDISLEPRLCPPTQWGIHATHTPVSYQELQRNKVLFG